MGAKVNWHKGLFRITIIASIAAGIGGWLTACIYYADADPDLLQTAGKIGLAIGFVSVWVVYFVLRFILRGFRS